VSYVASAARIVIGWGRVVNAKLFDSLSEDTSRLRPVRRTKAMTPEYAEIQRLRDAMNSACYLEQAAPTPASRRAARAAQDELFAKRATVRNTFAAQHGWVCSARHFTIDQLRRGSTRARRRDWICYDCPMDHREYFRLAKRPWRPVAILSHEYSSFEYSQALATKYGITATLLPASWYSPDDANAVLYMGFYSLCL
jgi:hypothetical protein